MSTVDTIKDRLSIVDVVGTYVKLEKAGANLKGLCPFHNEKSPSFFVSPARNSFYCFGCGAKGDIFSFVEQFESVDFMGALKVLADRAGVELVKELPQTKSERERVLKALESASLFYHKELSGNTGAREYLTKRGVSVATIKNWRLGYAPAEWRALYTYLTGRGFTAQELLKAGLVKQAEGGSGFYDVFRSRIMFPISDLSGRIIAFSGRIFPEEKDTAKYLNSPETMVFNKSGVLYGYDKAKLNIRNQNVAVLVEGQMDLILSHQEGVNNVVATSGTAFTERHAAALKRFAEQLVICFDGDSAGINASLRAAALALSQGLDVKVAYLPDGKDPADLVIENKALYLECLTNAEHVVLFALRSVMKKTTDIREIGKLVVAEVLPFIKSITSTVDQAHFLRAVAGQAGLREEALWEEFKKVIPAYQMAAVSPQNTGGAIGAMPQRTLESQLFGMLYALETGMLQSPPELVVSVGQRLRSILGDSTFEKIKQIHDPNRQDLILYTEVTYGSLQKLQTDLEEFIRRYEEENIKKAYIVALQSLTQAEAQHEESKIKELLALCKSLSDQLAAIDKQKK